jgi:Protein of unknown function (DUF3990)
MLYPPPPWTNAPVRLYHGTSERHAETIVSDGVKVSVGQANTDFGPGFYTTTLERQARNWAYKFAEGNPGETAAVVAMDVDRDALAWLHTLVFVRGDFYAEDFWSFVVHCRNGAQHHQRAFTARALYDVVAGPVSSYWKQRAVIEGADQVSFHTGAAEMVLNASHRFVSWTTNC